MSSPNTLGDPRSGRDRRVPTKTRAFKHGHIDPITSHKRPLLTVGNILLLIVGIGYGMYATGNLPQLDAFFDHADQVGKAHNSAVVNTLITYGTIIFGGVLVALFCLMVFLFFNSRRREHVDGKGWHKVADAPAERRSRSRRATADMPSLVMPLGKERPARHNTAATPDIVPAPIVAKAEPAPPAISVAASQPAASPKPETVTSAPDTAKAEAMAAAAKAEAAIATTPVDPPSFVRAPKFKVEPTAPAPAAVAKPEPITAPIVTAAPNASVKAEQVTSPPTAHKPTDASLLSATAANAKAEAAIAEAKAIAARAEAALASAKLEALIATAKAEAAAAEAAVAAAKAASLTT